MRERSSGTRIAVERLFKEHDLKLNTRIERGSSEAVKQTIMGGLGISVLSQHTVAQKAAMDELVILDVEHFPVKRKWYVVYPAAKTPTIIARTFLEPLRSESVMQ